MSRALLCAALALIAGPALAADNGFYLGAGIGQANVRISTGAGLPGFDENDTGYKLIAGFRPLDWLGAEVNYVDLGTPSGNIAGTRIKTDASGVSGFGLVFLEMPLVDLYGKLGVVRWDASAAAPGLGLSGGDSGTDFAWGAGVQVRLLSLGVRLEYERFEISDLDETSFLSLSVTYTFL